MGSRVALSVAITLAVHVPFTVTIVFSVGVTVTIRESVAVEFYESQRKSKWVNVSQQQPKS